jgi:hypothetical protein
MSHSKEDVFMKSGKKNMDKFLNEFTCLSKKYNIWVGCEEQMELSVIKIKKQKDGYSIFSSFKIGMINQCADIGSGEISYEYIEWDDLNEDSNE